MATTSELRLRSYLGCVYALGAAALAFMFTDTQWAVPKHALGILVVTATLIVVAELLPIRLWSRGSFNEYTFSGAFVLALLATGPIVYAVISQLVALLIEELRHRKPMRVVAFNAAQYALMFALAELVVSACEGVRFGMYVEVSQTRQVLGLALAAPVYLAVNN